MLNLLLFQQIAKLFILIFLGWAIVKAGILKSEDSKTLSMLLLYIITPCVCISGFQVERTAENSQMMTLSLLSALLMNGLCILLGALAARLFHLDVVEEASIQYPNAGNLIIPLVHSIFGSEWVMYVTVYTMIQTILDWTHARILISGKKKISLRDLVCNVNILAIMLGLLLFVFQIQLPTVIGSAFSMAGDTIGPVAMLITGMLMAGINMQHLHAYRQIWKPVLLRLIVLPVILVCVAKYSGLTALAPHGETLIIISLLSAVAPSASIVPQFCQMFGRDARYASLISTVTMLLCIITMPLMISLFQM